MKYLLSILCIYITLSQQFVFANGGVLGGIGDDAGNKIRNGDIHLNDLPGILKYAIDWVMGFAGTIAVIAIIIGSYKILFGAVGESHSTTEGKKYVAGALIGFAIAALAWFFVKLVIDNFS